MAKPKAQSKAGTAAQAPAQISGTTGTELAECERAVPTHAERVLDAARALSAAIGLMMADADDAVSTAQGDASRARALVSSQVSNQAASQVEADSGTPAALGKLLASAESCLGRVLAAQHAALTSRVEIGRAVSTAVSRLDGLRVRVSQPKREVAALLDVMTTPPAVDAAPNAAGDLPGDASATGNTSATGHAAGLAG